MLNGYFLQSDFRQAVYTPEEFWPTTGNDDLTFDESVAEGVENLARGVIKPLLLRQRRQSHRLRLFAERDDHRVRETEPCQ